MTESSELRLLTICINHVNQLISSDSLELFMEKIYEFIVDGKMKDDSRTILKILQFLSYPYWSQVSHLLLIFIMKNYFGIEIKKVVRNIEQFRNVIAVGNLKLSLFRFVDQVIKV